MPRASAVSTRVVSRRRVVDAGDRPRPRVHRDRREPGHGVDLVDRDRRRPGRRRSRRGRGPGRRARGTPPPPSRAAARPRRRRAWRACRTRRRRRGTWRRSRRTRLSPTMRISAGSDDTTVPSGRSSTAHSISRPTIAASTSTFGSCCRAVATAASRSPHAVTRVMPSDDPARAGLTKTGRPSRSRCGVGERRGPGPQHHVVAHRQAVGGEQLLGELLVHARRAGQHARADVGHARELQQALDRAVLAVGAVEHGEDDVDAREHLPGAVAVQHEQAAAGGVAGQRQRGAGGVDRRQGAVVDGQLAGVVGAHAPRRRRG